MDLSKMTLKRLLTLIIGGILVVAVLGVSLFSYNTFQNYNLEESVNFRKQQGLSVSIQVEQYVSNIEARLGAVSEAMQYQNGQVLNEETMFKMLSDLNKTASATATYIVFEDGSSLEHTGEKFSGMGLTGEWFSGPKSGKPFVLTEPSVDQISGKLLSSLTIPVMKDGVFIGVAGTDISSDVWLKLVEENVPDGQLFLIDGNDNILFTQYPDLLSKNIYEVRPMYRDFDGSHITYQINGSDEHIGTKNGPNPHGLTVFTYEPMEEILAPSQEMLKFSLWSALAFILICLGVIYVVIQKLIYVPIGGEPKHIQHIIERIAAGDLTVDAKAKGNDTGVYAATVSMVANLRAMVGRINTQSNQIESTSTELASLAENTRSSSTDQISQMELTSTAMNEMVSTVEEISRNAQHASTSATDAFEHAQLGAQVTTETSDVINKLGQDIEVVAETITELKNETGNVANVLNVIRDIAEQTNLLALNAAIEAARAGEQGRGFAVVADEVRSLASRTQNSIEEINTTISKLQTVAETAVDSMVQSQNQTQGAIEMATKARDSLSSILSSVDMIQDMNAQIATAAEEQNAVAQEINQSVVTVNGLATHTNENAMQTEESTRNLSSVVESLTEITSKFKV
ncbi:methyl-accepting chemotaxis protein [Vibrio sp. LaRot3]|uniref:methyl-accepting chemotaxis protein n=1 Tax=Vibrio sp. LaRot3 TaxID=2998829 RepID=UPI0022CDD16B|nr:methyl-accepting chemotaxis protein [Vibrio sp. LaRot3]MDA0147162.1 methyl-accepting chemotaxis protein [Vibrio sp. LaRot3]